MSHLECNGMNNLSKAISDWRRLADEVEWQSSLGLIHPKIAQKQVDCYRRTAVALEIEQQTGISVCSCCLKPLQGYDGNNIC